MKLNFNIYIVAFFLFFAFFSCKKNERVEENQEKAVMGSPENFIQQYQQWLDINDFEIIYIQFIEAAIYKQKMADILDCVTVNYDSLRMDCLKNKIPFQSISHLKKLYDEDYSSIITNYDKMLETKTKVEKMMNFSDTMGTKKQ